MIKYILPPVLGAVIGYITNDLAIRMLFHPYKEIYIGKWHVPFTPGLIPAQKNRLAKSLGDVVSGQLLSAQVLMKEALSQRARSSRSRSTPASPTKPGSSCRASTPWKGCSSSSG